MVLRWSRRKPLQLSGGRNPEDFLPKFERITFPIKMAWRRSILRATVEFYLRRLFVASSWFQLAGEAFMSSY